MKRAASGILPMIAVDRKAAKALHTQIYDAYRTAIVTGSLRPRQRIPSTRVLAAELGVSRFPVLNAYAQLLAEGYFESRVGAGTVVSSLLPEQLTSSGPTSRGATRSAPAKARFAAPGSGARRVARHPNLRRFQRFPWFQRQGAFGVGQVAFDQFPLHIWSKLVARRCRNMKAESFQYGDRTGFRLLRETLASYLRTSRSLHCEAEQVMIVAGSQQALEISARVLLDPGSSVWVEQPGYRLAQDAFVLNGCNLVPVPIDEEGLDVAAGIRRCPEARAALVTPSHQFPLGVTMSRSRRFQLLAWGHGRGSWIIEDDYDSEYRYESLPIASLQGLDASARVIYVGTFSKVLFPALRLGYIVIPQDLAEAFYTARDATDQFSSTLYQAVMTDFIREGHFGRHIRRMRVLYMERRAALVEAIHGQMGDSLEVIGAEAGMHLVALLPTGVSDVAVSKKAAEMGISAMPLSSCCLKPPARGGLILGYGGTDAQQIHDGIRKLRICIRP